MPPVLIWYLLCVNIFTFCVAVTDKWCAVKSKRRVPEKTLFTLVWCGGSIGLLLAMYLVRHKTQKPQFRYGVPAILLFEITLSLILQYLFQTAV